MHIYSFYSEQTTIGLSFFLEWVPPFQLLIYLEQKKEANVVISFSSKLVLPFQMVVYLMTFSSIGGDSIIFQLISCMCVVIL
jgi:hypothetical protein